MGDLAIVRSTDLQGIGAFPAAGNCGFSGIRRPTHAQHVRYGEHGLLGEAIDPGAAKARGG